MWYVEHISVVLLTVDSILISILTDFGTPTWTLSPLVHGCCQHRINRLNESVSQRRSAEWRLAV